MTRRMNIMMVVAILVILVATVSLVVQSQKMTSLAVSASAERILQMRTPTLAPAQDSPVPLLAAPVAAKEPFDAANVVKSKDGRAVAYTAADGDTLSNLACALLGSDSKQNRDVVIAGNPSLQADPDRVLAGTTYLLVVPEADPVSPAAAKAQTVGTPAAEAETTGAAPVSSDRVLKYVAQPGDTVSALAAGLLGSDSKTNRDAIVNQNRSLQPDPDRVVVGRAYEIPADNGLSAAPVPAVAPRSPTTQPDSDEVVRIGTGRELRYTARAGDTVSKLAAVLLGSDTLANRDAIIKNNAALKSDPDRVIAGQTYWIPAPVAAAQ